ncbi:hypothetical protein ASF24_15650 [Methylobacterium sp. Leaf86]|uniref:hypothetical protein n=1 Tax=Methylobacterium sp. Leaf86 TaxID=1736242 RepID=UPI0006F81186|nr:hypothetical protein [Methylobacterium sp. Leaf86]KQO58073.1 hypothetical protein ASF24_15650 [Methylobacterium sp. Leaf86]
MTLVERPMEWWAKRAECDEDGFVTAGGAALQDIEALGSLVSEIEGAVITHLVCDPAVAAAMMAFRPAITWKPRSIRAARRARGRMIGAMRAAEGKARRWA